MKMTRFARTLSSKLTPKLVRNYKTRQMVECGKHELVLILQSFDQNFEAGWPRLYGGAKLMCGLSAAVLWNGTMRPSLQRGATVEGHAGKLLLSGRAPLPRR